MNETETLVDTYLKNTGQTKQQLFAGSQFFGADFIYTDLIPKALKENKKIIWKDEPQKGLGVMSYSLQDL